LQTQYGGYLIDNRQIRSRIEGYALSFIVAHFPEIEKVCKLFFNLHTLFYNLHWYGLQFKAERCVIIRATWEQPLTVYHNFIQLYRRFLAFITAQYISSHQSFRLLYYRRCLIAGMFPSEAITAIFQCLSRR